MAHCDYDCCACCTAKLRYAGYDCSTDKEEFCFGCYELVEQLTGAKSAEDFLKWIKDSDDNTIKNALEKLVFFEKCYYENPIDDELVRRGLLGKDRPEQSIELRLRKAHIWRINKNDD